MSTVVMIKAEIKQHLNIKEWCLNMFGIDCKNLEFGKWYSPAMGITSLHGAAYYVTVQRTYVFRDEADAVLFKLRWS